jgi:hypothetical protein
MTTTVPTTTTADAAPLNDEQIDHLLQRFAGGFATTGQVRAPVLHDPAEAGLNFEEVTFPSMDGVPLEGWFIPAAGSGKLIIANHPMGFSRSGQPTHLDPWHAEWGTAVGGGNGFEVNFVPDLKILHDAGYNVLTYDLRNHGLSGSANGGMSTSGWFEARDVAGSLRYARRRDDTPHDRRLVQPLPRMQLHLRGHDAVPRGLRRRPMPGGRPAGDHRGHRQTPARVGRRAS